MKYGLYEKLVLGEVAGILKPVNPLEYGLSECNVLTVDNLKNFMLDKGKPFVMFKKEAVDRFSPNKISEDFGGRKIRDKYFFKIFFPSKNFDRFVYGEYRYIAYDIKDKLSKPIPYSVLKTDLIPAKGVEKTVDEYKFYELPDGFLN